MSKIDFLNDLELNTNLCETENGALTNLSTLNPLLDLFSLAGAMRSRDEEDIISLFEKAINVDKLRALKYVFYNGDIREGLGERRTFKILIKHLAMNHTELLKDNLHLIPFYNRWDSMYALVNTPLEIDMFKMIKRQLQQDLISEKPSLCAKWLKSLNASSKESKSLAKRTAFALNLCDFKGMVDKRTVYKNEEKYRKVLSELRRKIDVVERKMSAKDFTSINYSSVPSKAMFNYQNSFMKNDSVRYKEYLVDVALGNTKINSKTLYPYEIVKKILHSYSLKDYESTILEAQWGNLPDYIDGKDISSLCVVDTSGSMNGTPLEVALSLGLYCAERCSGAYSNKFITFSRKPTLETVKGSNLVNKIRNMYNADWGMSTDVEAVFDLILQTAIDNNSPQSDMPDNLIIISDMEFNEAAFGNRHLKNYSTHKDTLFSVIENKFISNGYKMPNLVFWNVDARNNQHPMTIDKNGWCSVSGFSPTIFKAILNGIILEEEVVIDECGVKNVVQKQKIDPIHTMLNVLDSERYMEVVINEVK